MPSVDESLLASLRAVIVMIFADGYVDTKQQKWFNHILKSYPLTPQQEEQLRRDFASPPDIEELWPLIRNREDRRRLMNLAKIAMMIDDQIHPDERKLFDRLVALNQNEASRAAYEDELIEHVKRLQMWESLEAFGRQLNAKRGWFNWIASKKRR
jgi:uncharacterized membrane protein YebE (DUF533 family)